MLEELAQPRGTAARLHSGGREMQEAGVGAPPRSPSSAAEIAFQWLFE